MEVQQRQRGIHRLCRLLEAPLLLEWGCRRRGSHAERPVAAARQTLQTDPRLLPQLLLLQLLLKLC